MPYTQGQLDGLCGVYALVNAIEATVANWNRDDADGLFRYLTGHLARQDRLDAAMAEGLGTRDLGRLIDHAGAYLAGEYGLCLERRYAFARPAPLARYWRRLETHLQTPGHAAIVGLWGWHEHWTCVRDITRHTMWTSDSGTNPIRRIYRAHCTTGRSGKRRRHELMATQTLLLFFYKNTLCD